MSILAKRERRLLWIAAVPMALLAISCVYPVFFSLNNALKTNKGYILDRFGIVTDPTLANFATAWQRAHLSDYFVNSVITTGGAVLLLLAVSSRSELTEALRPTRPEIAQRIEAEAV